MTRARVALAGGIIVVLAVVGLGWTLVRPVVGQRPDPGSEWDRYRVVEGGLVVQQWEGTCDRADGSDVEESASRVVVTTHVDRPPPWTVCAASAVLLSFRIVLEEPLGDRPVLDGACLARGGSETSCTRSSAR